MKLLIAHTYTRLLQAAQFQAKYFNEVQLNESKEPLTPLKVSSAPPLLLRVLQQVQGTDH